VSAPATSIVSALCAVMVAIAVPVGQVPTYSVQHHCCCPDQANCHCPKHAAPHGGTPSMRTCHEETRLVASSSAAPLANAVVAIEVAKPAPIAAPTTRLPAPHAPPDPDQPAAPS
jgi:hypothetical protein